ncbi:MAG: hypothetical protein OER85_11745, partial [Gammaproteobacteria bacterium]|nr:hypothetical protein [Gammaproteobacteria bacterium]
MKAISSISRKQLFCFACVWILAVGITACSTPEESQAPDIAAPPAEPQVPEVSAPAEAPEAAAKIAAVMAHPDELPTWKIPNIPQAAEAYYAPDNLHVIAQTQDSAALKREGRDSGALTYTFTDQGEDIRRINDRGQDACSYFFPDMKRLVWTSTKDNMDMPIGNWSDSTDYPQGAELYISDLEGGNIQRLTDNEYYEAEVSISPNGEWVVFGRQID